MAVSVGLGKSVLLWEVADASGMGMATGIALLLCLYQRQSQLAAKWRPRSGPAASANRIRV